MTTQPEGHKESPFAFFVTGDKERQKFVEEAFMSSDRVGVIVCVARLDELLKELLQSLFIHGDKKVSEQILDPVKSGALGTIAARNQLAYLLGYLHKDTFDLLKVFMRLRNHFAHTWDVRNLSDLENDPKGKTLLGKLDEAFESCPFNPNPLPIQQTPRYRFSMLYLLIESALESAIREARREKTSEITTDEGGPA